jgi:type IV pilus assembly protein PilY1
VALSSGQVLPAEWDAATIISAQDPDTGREILSWRPTDGTGVAFRWASDETYLSTAQKALLGIHPSSGLSDGLGEDRLLYVRGNEISGFRSRMETVNGVEIKNVFGDIVHSTPALVGAPNSGYPDSIEPTAPYSAFKSLYGSRASMLYVGGNDGMLHAIDATPVTGGQEKLAYVPNGVLAKLPQLTLTNYNHKYFVDGPPTVVDAYLGTSWKTVLVSGLGAGGRSVFALDVTDPTTFNESNAANLVLWEIDNTTTGFSDLGHTFSQPAIFKEQGSGNWVAAFGNGFGGSKAVLYFVDLATGTLLRSIELDNTAGNGMATIAPVDRDKNGMVDLIYAGDLKGNVWRLEVGATGFNSSDTSLLYVAKDAAGNRQSITTRVDVGAHPFSGTGRMVYIGTGTYYLDTDNEPGTQANSVYGVWDKDDGATVTSVTTRSGDISLLKQEVELTPTLYGVSTRVVSDNSMDWSTQSGWFLDLPTTGERMASNMTLRAGRLIFVTTIPSSAPCESGGSSWLMEINAATGGRLYETVFDLDGDGTFDVGDMVDTDGDGNADTEISGRRFDSIVQNPSIIRAGQGSESAGGYKEYKYLSSSDGSIKQVTESTPLTSGRKSWLQIQ